MGMKARRDPQITLWKKQETAGGITLPFTAKALSRTRPLGLTTRGPLRREPKKRAHRDKAAPTRNKRVKLERLIMNIPRIGDKANEKFTASKQYPMPCPA